MWAAFSGPSSSTRTAISSRTTRSTFPTLGMAGKYCVSRRATDFGGTTRCEAVKRDRSRLAISAASRVVPIRSCNCLSHTATRVTMFCRHNAELFSMRRRRTVAGTPTRADTWARRVDGTAPIRNPGAGPGCLSGFAVSDRPTPPDAGDRGCSATAAGLPGLEIPDSAP
jgi:hypothetical protein